jgi:hypothetical protein
LEYSSFSILSFCFLAYSSVRIAGSIKDFNFSPVFSNHYFGVILPETTLATPSKAPTKPARNFNGTCKSSGFSSIKSLYYLEYVGCFSNSAYVNFFASAGKDNRSILCRFIAQRMVVKYFT